MREYRWLLDRDYPPRGTIKLVGDRRRLSADGRLILFRGVASEADSARRRARLHRPGAGSLLLLDAYNVAFTLVHYMLGKPCFVSSDGLLRDAGANYGRVSREELLERAFGELAAFLGKLSPGVVEAWLDAPVSRSGVHAAALRRALGAQTPVAEVSLASSADGAILARLKGFGRTSELGQRTFVLSSDSVLADRSPQVFDAARALLEENYAAHFLDLGRLCEGAESP